ncbi:MAG: hypothetical protein ACXW3O_04030 [Brevundimonas sp.]
MSADPSGPAPWSARLGRLAARVRPGHLFAATALAAVFGLAGLQAVALPGPRPITDAERLQIEVVTPPEPEITPGSVMDVGELVDGFQGVPRPVVQAAFFEESGDSWEMQPEPVYDRSRRPVETAVIHAPPQPEPPRRTAALERWFGFDAPRRDYRAEREARRARWESRADRYDRDQQQDRYERDEREARFEERDAPRRYRSDSGERERREAPVRYDRLAEDGWD